MWIESDAVHYFHRMTWFCRWDKIEVSDTVQTLEKIWTKATEPDVNQLTLQDSNGAYELSDDELMHMLNNIGKQKLLSKYQ